MLLLEGKSVKWNSLFSKYSLNTCNMLDTALDTEDTEVNKNVATTPVGYNNFK